MKGGMPGGIIPIGGMNPGIPMGGRMPIIGGKGPGGNPGIPPGIPIGPAPGIPLGIPPGPVPGIPPGIPIGPPPGIPIIPGIPIPAINGGIGIGALGSEGLTALESELDVDDWFDVLDLSMLLLVIGAAF